jgi:hypothetical protein
VVVADTFVNPDDGYSGIWLKIPLLMMFYYVP